MKTKLAKGILLILSLLCILCVPVTPVYAVKQGTDGSELQVVKAEQLEIQLGTAWSGVEFQLKTDAGVYPGAVKVGTDGVLRLEIGGSSRYILTCMNSSTSIPEPEDTADEMVRKIRALQETGQREIAQMEEQEKQRLIEIAGKYEDCVYIEVSSVHSGSTLVYHLGDAVGIVNPGVHIGMFQDSVLYMKYATEEDPCALDFRYFPKGFGDVMETYSWSDNIKQAVIKNQKGHSLIFNHEEIAPGETKVFTPDTHKQGLFSPDCYNGKSLFTMGEEDAEKED